MQHKNQGLTVLSVLACCVLHPCFATNSKQVIVTRIPSIRFPHQPRLQMVSAQPWNMAKPAVVNILVKKETAKDKDGNAIHQIFLNSADDFFFGSPPEQQKKRKGTSISVKGRNCETLHGQREKEQKEDTNFLHHMLNNSVGTFCAAT